MAAEVTGRRIKVGSRTRKKGGDVRPCPAVQLYFSCFLTLWVVSSRLHEAALHWTSSSSSAGSSSLVRFRLPIQLMWTDLRNWVVYLLVFQATFFTYYAFLTAEQWGFILSCLSDSQSPSRTLTASGITIFTSLPVYPVMEIVQTQIFQNGGFRLPPSSTWPPPPSWVEPWKICWWKHKLPIKKYLEEVSLSMWQMSVWWQ